MYLPQAFRQEDRDVLHDFIERHSFAVIVSQTNGELFASHLPLLLERDAGPWGSLVGHMARANPQWTHAADQSVMAVFSGPHAYISPSWYEAERVVPTWNYAAVHAYGRLQVIAAPAEIVPIVRDAVEFYERSMPRPWTTQGREEYVDQLAQAIVGFRISIDRIEGKWKLSQNHPEERRAKVIAALEARGDENSRSVAALMRREQATGAQCEKRERGDA